MPDNQPDIAAAIEWAQALLDGVFLGGKQFENAALAILALNEQLEQARADAKQLLKWLEEAAERAGLDEESEQLIAIRQRQGDE